MEVIVVETGEYEQRYVVLVAATEDAAETAIKEMYRAPYVVSWEKNERGLCGKFSAVIGFSTEHVGQFDFTTYPLKQ